MRIKSVLVLLAVFILIPISSMASEINAGEDVNPADNEAPFTIAERTSPSVDGDVWSLSIVMNDEVKEMCCKLIMAIEHRSKEVQEGIKTLL